MTEEERRRRLVAMGLDPSKYSYVTNEEEAYEDMTAGGAFLTGAKQTVGGGIGGLGGAALGASYGSAFGPVGTLVGGLGGGIIGGIAGGFGQAAVEDAVLDDAEEQALALKRQVALEKHPHLTLAGQFAPSLLAVKPSFTTLSNLPRAFVNAPTRSQTAMQRYALASAGFGGGLEAGVEAGSQALREDEMDWSRVATAGLLGATLTEPTKLFGKIGATAARKGETSEQFLERTGMLRPLTEDEAIARNTEIAAEHQASLKEAIEKNRKDLDAAEASKAAKEEVKAEADEARRTEPTKEQELDAEKQINRDIDAADTARMKAHGAWVKADNELNNLPPDLVDTPFVAKARKNVAGLKSALDEATDNHTNLLNERVRMREERAAKELEANSLWERHSRRKAAIEGTEPRPLPDNLLDAAQGLAAKLGITWHKAVPELYALDKAGERIDLRGKYDLKDHSITLDSLRAEADTPFHEYLHGLWQVLKRSLDRKHKGLIELFENELFKDSPRRQKLKSTGERKIWSEEAIVESTGKALTDRMDNPPKGWIDKLQQWLDDWRLERDARKGFPVKEGELTEDHFKRIVDWLAMRGERQPALQPKQLELMLGDLAVKSPLMSGLTPPTAGGKKYVDDVKTEEALAEEKAAPAEDIRGQAVDARAGTLEGVAEIIQDDVTPMLDHTILAHRWQNLLNDSDPLRDSGLTYEQKQAAEQELYRQLNNDEDVYQLKDVEIASREAAKEAIQSYDTYTEDMSLSYADRLSKDLGITFGEASDILATLNMFAGDSASEISKQAQEQAVKYFGRQGGEDIRTQPVKPEEFAAAVDVMAKHDPTLLKKYSKRVRGKMMDRIKKGTFSVARGQQILARFVNKPFPEDMSGEEIAQVINGMEMHHGSPEADAIRREGFKGEELSEYSNYGRGIYMTPDKDLAASYAGTDRVLLPTTNEVSIDLDIKDYSKNISIRTNFKNILDLDSIQADPQAFRDSITTKGREMGRDVIESSVYRRMKDANRQLPNTTRQLVTSADVALGGNINAVLHAMGYDGLTVTQLNRATNLYSREVVAFREPFEKATNQLHEYYGGERLQDVDTFLEEMNDYQLNTNTDNFANNPATKLFPFLDSITERIRTVAHKKGSADEQKTAGRVADAAEATARDAQRLEGEFLEGFEFIEQGRVSLSDEDARHAGIYMAYTRRGMPEEIPAATLARYNEPDSPVKHYVEYFYDKYTDVRTRQIKAGMKIYHPKSGEITDPKKHREYAPEIIRQDMWRILNGKEGAKARTDAKKELIDWWENNLDEPGSITREELTQAADQYIAKLSGDSAHLGSTKFGALRKAESIGLPLRRDDDGNFAWIESHAGLSYMRYMRRFARDFAFYKNMENDSFVRQALGLMKQDRTYDGALPEGTNPFHVPTKVSDSGKGRINTGMTSDKNLKDFVKAYLGYYEGDELFGRTANRLVVSHWLGAMSGVRDLFSSYVFALPHLRGVDMPLILSSLGQIRRNWYQSHLLGVNKSHANRLEFNTETHSKLADTINTWSDIASKYSGRTPLERLTRTVQFGLGRAAVLQHIGLAEGASITADRNLRRLGQMSGVDVKALRNHADKSNSFKIPDKQLDDMLDRMAASWVDANQGTYDVRGVPAFTMSGPYATFTSLARWNIEKWNMTKKELVRPLVDEGDWRPILKATLGAVFTGTLLIELSEFINNKFRANPTLMEAVKEGHEEEITYAVADALAYAGYFGLGSALVNDTVVALSRGERMRTGGVVFPALDFVGGSLTEPMFDANTAIKEGAEPLPTVWAAIHDVFKNTTQTYRILWNNSFLVGYGEGAKEVEKQNIRRDLRIFRRFEGVRGMPPSADVGNRYLRPDTREFKEAETLQESVERLPAAFEEQRERAKGRGDKLKSYAQGLYTIPDKTLPSVATPEGVEEFMRYKDYVMRQRGGGAWQRIFNDWARNKQLTATKKALVKSYVQHLMERNTR